METRLLNLSSYDINPSDALADYYNKTVSTPYGTVSNNRWSLTWNNIDFSKVMGDDFYNRYNLFKITMVSYNLLPSPTSQITTTVTAEHYQDFYVNWYLQGLSFYPPVYNNATNGAMLNTGYIPMDVSFVNYNMTSSLSWAFTKVKNTNLSINMKCAGTDQPYNPATDSNYLWGHSFFTFQIVGIPDIIYPTLSAITYGTSLVSSLNASVISGIDGSLNYFLDNSKTTPVFTTTYLNAGVATIYADFIPTNSFYSGYTQSVSLLVNQAPTTTTFSAPSAITYGADLTSSLSSSASVPGVFTYFTDASFINQVYSSSILDAATYTIYSLLTPTSANYLPSSDSKQLIVNKASTSLTFPNITSIIYGVPTGSTLSALLTGATTNISGGIYDFYVNDSSGLVLTTSSVLSVGTYIIFCQYTSQNNNFLSCTGSTTVAIQAHSTSGSFSISTPETIIYGTNLTSILNASANLVEGISVAGTISYYTDASYNNQVFVTDILSYGNYTIYAVFRPDSLDYLTSVVTTFLTVNQMPTVITVNPQSIFYKTNLSEILSASVLTNAGADVSGTTSFYYDNTFASVANVVNYRYYKFTNTLLRGGNGMDMVQYSELNLRYNGTRVDYSTAVASNPGGSGFSNFSQGIDNLVTTKFSDINKAPLVIDFGKNTKVTDYTFATANDSTGRDPISWIFYGSNDNSTWTTLDTQNNYPTPTARQTYLSYFTVTDNLNVGSYTIYVRFVPSSNNYVISTANYSLTVNQKPTTITFPSYIDISYNATLSSFITNTFADVSGSFTFTDVSTNVLTTASVYNYLGQYIINANFTPTLSNYANSTASYSNLYVRYAAAFSFTTTSKTIVYGTNLSSVLITNNPSFNGTAISGNKIFYLTTIGGTIVDNSTNFVPGSYVICAQFVPTDSTRYYTKISSNTKTCTVTKASVYPMATISSAYIQSTPYQVITYAGLVLGDTSSNSLTFTSITTHYITYASSYTLATASAQTDIPEYIVYNTGFSGTSKTYTIYMTFNGFSSSKYQYAFNKITFTINKIPTQLTFNIPESLKTISYGTPLSTNQLCATITNTITSTPVSYGQITYTLSATDLTQSVNVNSVFNSGTYYIFANYVDASNIYINGNTFAKRTNTVQVSKIKSTITTPNITSIVSGTTMNSFISGTTINVPGSLHFYTPSNQ
jgi:hypothetical protein